MEILTWIIFGLIAGAIAKIIMPGKQNMGWIITTLLGIVGAVVGGWVGSLLGIGTVGSFSIGSLCIAVVGALIVLFVFSKFSK